MLTKKHSTSLIFPLLLVFYEIATYLSNDMYLPGMPQMMQELGLNAQQIQLTLTTWFIGQACLPFIMGGISDRFGRRPVLLLSGIIYILSTIICAVTSNYSILLFARFVEGSMIGPMMVAGYSCIHELYDQKHAIRILALMGSITVLAPAFGPLLGSFVLLFMTWRGIFWIIALWAAFAIVLLYKWMPETLTEEKRQELNLQNLINQYGTVLTNKKFILLMAVLGFMFSGFIVWVTGGPLLVMESFQQSAIAFGILQGILFSANICAARSVKYIIEKTGVTRLIQIGMSIAFVGGVLTWLASLFFPHSLYIFLITMMIFSFGTGLAFAPLNRLVIESSMEPMGIRVATFTIFLTLYAALGSGLSSIFYNGTIASLASLIAICILISNLMLLVVERMFFRAS